MTVIDERIRDSVRAIVAQEEDRASVDWRAVEAEASATIAYINENKVEIDNLIYHFLEDADARRKSETYALHQTADVLKMLEDTEPRSAKAR
jgi:hypothetical protein